jgi:Uma2 family endonuclease
MEGPMSPTLLTKLPDHTQLPDTDGRPVENFLEHPQTILLTESALPVLRALHPDGQFVIGQNSGIYWKITDPPLNGCKAPDWFYVPNRPPLLDGQYRRSYVLWQEHIAPTLIIEIASGDGSEERDKTPEEGKFWVYEKAVRAPFYAIFVPEPVGLEVYELVGGRYRHRKPNKRGHYAVEPMNLALGLWHGTFMNLTLDWLRFYDLHGLLLPAASESAEQERQRAEQERQAKEAALERAARLAAKLRELGFDPDQMP